jgi:hypothetical protein
MAVTTDELAGYPRGTFTESGYTIERRVKIAWGDIDALAQELLPSTVVIGSQVVVSPPAEFPGNPLFHMSSFAWQPLASEQDSTADTDANGLLSPEYAQVTIIYKPMRMETSASGTDPVPLLKHDGRSSGQFTTMPTTGWKIQNAFGDTSPTLLASSLSLPDDIPVGHYVSTGSHSILWNRVVQPPWQALEERKSVVNESPFMLRGYLYPVEAILFCGYDFSRSIQSDGGTDGWDITLHFETRIVPSADHMGPDGYDANLDTGGWNHVYIGNAIDEDSSEVAAGYYRLINGSATPLTGEIYDDGSRNSIYHTYDFHNFFEAGS